jgi:hypothetical protein
MVYVAKMISVQPDQAEWIDKNDVNLSKFVRGAIQIASEQDSRDISEVVRKLRLVNAKLNELLAAYQADLQQR